MTIEEREERLLTLAEIGRELDDEEEREPSPLGELFAELMAGGVGYDCKEVTR